MLRSNWFPILLGIIIVWVIIRDISSSEVKRPEVVATTGNEEWTTPDINSLADDSAGRLIRYGKELIANTARYFGPHGTIAPITNGMNCQNCHIEAGTRPFGNSFFAVATTYPKYRERSGRVESVEWRIRECMERSLNGKSIDSTDKEMKAMVAYVKWVGKDVKKGEKPMGAGLRDLAYLNRAADPMKGKIVYQQQCQRCHGTNGEGLLRFDSTGYAYPPLWGEHSFNVSAGMYRLSRLAAYVKDNMPFGIASYKTPQLSDEEAWDVAAYINSQSRPALFFKYDWPNIASKPVEYPFGPYSDPFSQTQHKFGPFEPIHKAKAGATVKSDSKQL